ncbi:MAG: LNS2 domain-containing protein [Nannocystaceae bacterium]
MRTPFGCTCLILSSLLPLLSGCGDGATETQATGTDPTTGFETSTGPTTDEPTTEVTTEGPTGTDSESDVSTTEEPTTTDGTDTDTDTDTDTSGNEPVPGALCDPIPNCEAPLPGDGDISEALNHRGYDMFYRETDDQWILAKFAEGNVFDFDLEDEEVSIYLLRGCSGEWEFLGTAFTTDDDDHPTVEGVEDTGGRLYFQIPEDMKLGLGRHRIHMILEDDNSRADQYIDVVPEGAPMFISDVDGTLTTSEFEEFGDLLTGDTPEANSYAAGALTLLESKGYHPMYMTARPEFLYKRTRDFIRVRGFPHGLVRTSLSKDGALGDEAIVYKTGQLDALANKGLAPTYVIGNSETDAAAYDNAGILPLENRIFYQYTDDAHGGRRIESYEELLAEFEALPDLCGDN